MKIVVIGLGGTGSYFLNDLINYIRLFPRINIEIDLVDGDVLEERNLLRQGFLQKDIGRYKVEALGERFRKIVGDKVTITEHPMYIDTIKDLEEIAGEQENIIFVSCVDNNMARYRILMTQFKIHEQGKRRVIFLDAGNEEWHGQVLVNDLKKGIKSPVIYQEGEFKYTEKTEGHQLSTIFDSSEDWEGMLQVGEHEESCDIITEVSPQNIVTNMMSATGLIYMLDKVLRKNFKGLRLQYDVRNGTQEEIKVEGNKERIQQMVEYANGDGKKYLFEGIEEKEEIKEEIEEQEGTLEQDSRGIREGVIGEVGWEELRDYITEEIREEYHSIFIKEYLEGIGIDMG